MPPADPDARTCPACNEDFLVIDAKDWRKYATHLEDHLS